jgi:hypothetical protein
VVRTSYIDGWFDLYVSNRPSSFLGVGINLTAADTCVIFDSVSRFRDERIAKSFIFPHKCYVIGLESAK